jgi:D5 N terminal like/Family of unknown function (DUF5906)
LHLWSLDDILWSYANGVWSPDRHVVRTRTAQLLGEQYRRGHGANTEDVVRARSPRINSEPIPEIINFRNGLYDWHTDTLHSHAPDVLSTVQLPVRWNPAADCPQFDTFLRQVVAIDMIPTVWELIGYLMYSGNPLHKAVMLMGSGCNGKGTLLRVLTALLGARNVTSVSLHDLANTRFTTVSVFGKIANIAGDIDATYLESTARFKAITGQDTISAEHKGRDRFDFSPWAVPVFSANKIPPSSDVPSATSPDGSSSPSPMTSPERRTAPSPSSCALPPNCPASLPRPCPHSDGSWLVANSRRARPAKPRSSAASTTASRSPANDAASPYCAAKRGKGQELPATASDAPAAFRRGI